MGVEEIIKKHNYNEDIANYLRKAYPELVNYFNNEQIVYEALLNAPIKLTDNLYNCLKENGFLNNNQDAGVVSYDTLKVCAGVYHSEPNIKYDKSKEQYTIDSVNRIVAINAYSLVPDFSKGTLSHELCHLIKSYNNEYTIKGDTVVEKSGLITRIYQLKNNNGEVSKELWSETGVGLEEGLNAVAEEKVTSNVIGQPYTTGGYKTLREIAKNILNYNIPELHEIIKEAEIYHDNVRINSTLGETYYKLIEFTDKIYPLIVQISNINVGMEERKQIAEELDRLILEEYKPLTVELKSIGQSSMNM